MTTEIARNWYFYIEAGLIVYILTKAGLNFQAAHLIVNRTDPPPPFKGQNLLHVRNVTLTGLGQQFYEGRGTLS